MSTANVLRAKSLENGNLLLADHLLHAAEAAEAIGLDPTLARLGGLLHDIGKAHPEFQRRLTQKRIPNAAECIFTEEERASARAAAEQEIIRRLRSFDCEQQYA